MVIKDILAKLHYLHDKVDRTTKAKEMASEDLLLASLHSPLIKQMATLSFPKDFIMP